MDFDLARRRFLYRSLTGRGRHSPCSICSIAICRPLRCMQIRSRRRRRTTQPKAKSCIFLTMLGGVSQMDSFDPKPALEKFDNTVMDWSKEKNTDQANLFAKPRLILRSAFPFQKYGQCGVDVSSLFPHTATCVDDMAFVRSIQTENGNHPAAVFLMNTGVVIPGQAESGARGSPMAWAPKIRTCRRSWCCPISARCRSAARSNGARDFFRRATRARCCAGRAIRS